MPYMGELKKQVPYVVNVDNGAGAGKCAVSILRINSDHKVAQAETFTVPAGTRQQISDTLGAAIVRTIVQIRPIAGTQLNVEVAQAATGGSFPQTCVGDTDLVFDSL